MTGLEKIIEQILADAQTGADSIISDAKKQADSIIADAEKRAEASAEETAAKAESETAIILSRAEAACSIDAGRRLLNKKQEIIGRCIEQARQSLISLPDDGYSDLLVKMIKRFALAQAGEIMFSACDAKRINNAVKSAAMGSDLTVSDTYADSDGGFVLIYGGIEINCTFSALFAENREKLQDRAHELLF